MLPNPIPPHGGNLVVETLGRAFGALFSMFWPVFVPIGLFALIAFAAYLWRRFTNVG